MQSYFGQLRICGKSMSLTELAAGTVQPQFQYFLTDSSTRLWKQRHKCQRYELPFQGRPKFNIVNMIIGTVGSDADIQLAASIPLMSGMAKSSNTKSGFTSLNFLPPDHPLSASPQ